MTITAAQCLEAADLIAEREGALETLARMRKAKFFKIEYGAREMTGFDDDKCESFRASGVTTMLPITAAIRKLFQSETEDRLAAIDAKLRALGVEPPPAAVTDEASAA